VATDFHLPKSISFNFFLTVVDILHFKVEPLKFRTIRSIDTCLDHPLAGCYSIVVDKQKFLLKPCEITEKNQATYIANFVLEFDVDVNLEKIDPELQRWGKFKPDLPLQMKAEQIAGGTARDFTAWLSCATRAWVALSHHGAGEMTASLGPCKTVPLDSIRNNFGDSFHLKVLKTGEFEEVKRPDLRRFPLERVNLKLPADFVSLTDKLFSLPERYKEKFLEACASYMFALQNIILFPSVSAVSFCTSIESMLETTPQYCEYKEDKCVYKRNIKKKFTKFFEDYVPDPPNWMERFVGKIYNEFRSKPVHRGILWKIRGPSLGSPFSKTTKMGDFTLVLAHLEMLVNIALINWLADR